MKRKLFKPYNSASIEEIEELLEILLRTNPILSIMGNTKKTSLFLVTIVVRLHTFKLGKANLKFVCHLQNLRASSFTWPHTWYGWWHLLQYRNIDHLIDSQKKESTSQNNRVLCYATIIMWQILGLSYNVICGSFCSLVKKQLAKKLLQKFLEDVPYISGDNFNGCDYLVEVWR